VVSLYDCEWPISNEVVASYEQAVIGLSLSPLPPNSQISFDPDGKSKRFVNMGSLHLVPADTPFRGHSAGGV